uniref:Uncharacterized protein n=1 Tax=Peronospora effusa TaxID=542832 RepID=A0A3Q8U9M8_9STRA|nr:hypothetical protein [Peronospora effusa]AZL93042.1 hypothetical protein [Peronospora effusa]
MELIKKLQIKLQTKLAENLKIITSILITLSLSSIILYLDPFDLNFFNKRDILDLKENLEEKEDLNLEKKEDLNLEKKEEKTNNNIYYYLLAASVVVVSGIFLYCYFNDGSNNPDLIKEGFEDILKTLSESYHEHFLDPDTGRSGVLFKKVVCRYAIIDNVGYEGPPYNIYPPSSIASTDNFEPFIHEEIDHRHVYDIDWFNHGFREYNT